MKVLMNLGKHKNFFHIYISLLKDSLGNMPVTLENVCCSSLLYVNFTFFVHIKTFLVSDMHIYKAPSDPRMKSAN